MTIKAIMLDVDGVLILHPDARGWGANLQRDIGIDPSALQAAFFAPHWDDVIHGRASLRERLEPALQAIAPHMTYEKVTRYWFGNDTHVNQAVLADVAAIRSGGTEVHLATVQEHERARYLWDELDLRSRFDALHYAADLGCAKPSRDFYRSIEDRTGFEPHELLLIDDRMENVEAAIASGWAAARWTGEDTFPSLLYHRM